jgi:hypothetical protein
VLPVSRRCDHARLATVTLAGPGGGTHSFPMRRAGQAIGRGGTIGTCPVVIADPGEAIHGLGPLLVGG